VRCDRDHKNKCLPERDEDVMRSFANDGDSRPAWGARTRKAGSLNDSHCSQQGDFPPIPSGEALCAVRRGGQGNGMFKLPANF
jgi:hypothetical protein